MRAAVHPGLRSFLGLFLTAQLVVGALAQEPASPAPPMPPAPQRPQQRGYRLRVDVDLVLLNVVVRDKRGELVRGLTRDDFEVFEDGRAQNISTFDFENVDEFSLAGAAQPTVAGAAPAPSLRPSAQTGAVQARDRRLMVLFFDFTAMEPEEIERAAGAAKNYVERQMQPADLVAIVSLATSLRVDQDFTSEKERLLRVLDAYVSGQGQGFENGAAGDSEGLPESGAAFTPDESDYNQFNTDRKLFALESLAQALAPIQQKKSIIYFTNGISRSGIENQTALRAATAACVRANCAIYPMDLRGLEALPSGGAAQSASLHGRAAYSGQSVLAQFEENASTQETLVSLAADTGGKAFLDSNDFTQVFRKVQQDTSAYYVIGYLSANKVRDGRFRRVRVRVKRPGLKLEYRPGYFAPRDFQHSDRADRERQLEEELASDLPSTDVAVYVGAAFFQLDESRSYIPVSLIVPGSQIPFVQSSDKDKATLDILGVVLDSAKIPFGRVRETLKLNVDASQQVRRKNVQYNTGFILPPGTYQVKFVVRENQTGRVGSFATELQIPDLRKAPLRFSSIVLGNQRVASKAKSPNPLVRDGQELVPNVTHVFTPDQHLLLQYEVYDPARAHSADGRGKRGVRVLTSLILLQGDKKIYETQPVEARELTDLARRAVVFQLDLPLAKFRPGLYTCQVNIIDDSAGAFAFPRAVLLIKPPPTAPAAAAPSD